MFDAGIKIFVAVFIPSLILGARATFILPFTSSIITTDHVNHRFITNSFPRRIYLSRFSSGIDADATTHNTLTTEIKQVANELWKGEEMPVFRSSSTTKHDTAMKILEGEARLPDGIGFGNRAEHFRREAMDGCPRAQHSTGLLLWSGFGGVERDAEASARFHAAAAAQHHLDGMAVLGGCLRTGTGVKKNVPLGLELIEYCASARFWNPTGINKKAALLESNHDEAGAVRLYEDCAKNGRENAQLLFNLGWCLVNGLGVEKDERRGISLWKDAAKKAPDEGSEEAAWYLYEEYKLEFPKEAGRWLHLATELGMHEEY